MAHKCIVIDPHWKPLGAEFPVAYCDGVVDVNTDTLVITRILDSPPFHANAKKALEAVFEKIERCERDMQVLAKGVNAVMHAFQDGVYAAEKKNDAERLSAGIGAHKRKIEELTRTPVRFKWPTEASVIRIMRDTMTALPWDPDTYVYWGRVFSVPRVLEKVLVEESVTFDRFRGDASFSQKLKRMRELRVAIA